MLPKEPQHYARGPGPAPDSSIAGETREAIIIDAAERVILSQGLGGALAGREDLHSRAGMSKAHRL